MPWRRAGAKRHTKKANTPKKQALWVKIANRLLADGASEESAIKQANVVIKRQRGRRKS